MNTNPDNYKDLIGKNLICAFLSLGNGKGGRVKNIKEATFDIRRCEITKIEVIERKDDWKVIAYFDKVDRFYNNTIVACTNDGLRGVIEHFGSGVPKYTYHENQDDYYCGDVADYKILDEGQTDEEIRTILEEKVKEQFEKEVQALEERIARLKETQEELKKFFE